MTGCVNRAYINATRAFYSHNYQQAAQSFEEQAAKHDKNFALYSASLGSAALQQQQYDQAERAFLSAVDVMTSTDSGGRGTLSLISAESIKIYKGEPFEKAMAYFYLGIIYYNRQDFENARASFRKALLMDKQSEEGFREDLRLVFFMLGKTFLKLGDNENAKVAFEKARQRGAASPYPSIDFYNLEKMKRANVTILVELGSAPVKFRRGPGEALDDFRRARFPERGTTLFLDDQRLGSTVLGLDLAYEARHRGSSGKDTVQASKGVARDAALVTAAVAAHSAKGKNKKTGTAVALGALGFALLNRSEADIRQWDLLPGEVHVFSGLVPPGEKTLTIEFYSTYGQPMPAYRQVWQNFRVDEQVERVYLFRSGLYKGDGSFLIQNAASGE